MVKWQRQWQQGRGRTGTSSNVRAIGIYVGGSAVVISETMKIPKPEITKTGEAKKIRDPRATHDWTIRGLTCEQILRIKELTGYVGPAEGEDFFLKAVWWWRPLLGILGDKAHAIEFPPAKGPGFFPESTFREMKESESLGSLNEILELWFLHELAARIDGAFSIWPAYTMEPYYPLSGKDHLIEVPAHVVDLRKKNDELAADYKRLLSELRDRRRKESGWDIDDRLKKDSYLNLAKFSTIELIDRKKSKVGEKKVEDWEWANVNAALRQRKNDLSRG